MGTGDIWIPRLVVCFLGLVSLAAVAAATIISLEKGEIPNIISSLATGSITTLGMVAISIYGQGKQNGTGPTEPVAVKP